MLHDVTSMVVVMKKKILNKDIQTREKLTLSAIELLDEKPSSQISFREIAARAGLSHMTAYRYFKTMDEVFETVAEEGYKRLAAELRACANLHQESPRGLLENVFLVYFSFAQSHPHHLSAMFDRGTQKGKYKRTSFLEAIKELLEEYLGIIRICQKAEVFPPGWNENELGMMIWSFFHGYTILETKAELKLVMHSRPDPKVFVKNGVSVFIEGLAKQANHGTTRLEG